MLMIFCDVPYDIWPIIYLYFVMFCSDMKNFFQHDLEIYLNENNYNGSGDMIRNFKLLWQTEYMSHIPKDGFRKLGTFSQVLWGRLSWAKSAVKKKKYTKTLLHDLRAWYKLYNMHKKLHDSPTIVQVPMIFLRLLPVMYSLYNDFYEVSDLWMW